MAIISSLWRVVLKCIWEISVISVIPQSWCLFCCVRPKYWCLLLRMLSTHRCVFPICELHFWFIKCVLCWEQDQHCSKNPMISDIRKSCYNYHKIDHSTYFRIKYIRLNDKHLRLHLTSSPLFANFKLYVSIVKQFKYEISLEKIF